MEKVEAGGFVSLFSTPFKWRKEFLFHRSQKDEVGRDVRWYLLSSTPPQKQDHLDLVAKDHSSMAFEFLPPWRWLLVRH